MRRASSEFLTELLEEASAVAREKFGSVSGVVKAGDSNQVLTEADLAIGNLLITRIQRAYPGDSIIDEEAGVIDNKSDYVWVIDPIDGTSNFAQGVPLYGIMVGLLQKGVPVAGAVALPAFSEICLAEKGGGSWCNNRRLTVSADVELRSTLLAYGIDAHPQDPDFTRRECSLLAEIVLSARNIRCSNSVFDAVMVAKGKYGAVLNQTARIWDNVAQQVLIEEAGGIYTDFFGKPIDYSNPLTKIGVNFSFCAAPPALHDQLQRIIGGTGGC